MYLDERGVEQFISWVLLVGLAVGLAALVTNWAINNARQFDPSDDVNNELYCQDASITINISCHIRNNGVFGIDKIIVQQKARSEKIVLNPRLLPGEARSLSKVPPDGYGIDCSAGKGYIPVIISEEGRDVVCSVKKVSI